MVGEATVRLPSDVYKRQTKGLHLASVKTHEQPTQKDYQLLSYLGRINLSAYDKDVYKRQIVGFLRHYVQ